MTATARTGELRSIAQAITDALPARAEEVVLTGSVSRGVADDISDIEMLIVAQDELDLGDCFSLAAACGLTDLGTWGLQGGPTKRVSGYRDGAPIELIWWSRAHAETAIDAIFTVHFSATADAIERDCPTHVRAAGAVAGPTSPLSRRARQRWDRGRCAQVGRLPCGRFADAPAAGRTARAAGVDG